MVAPVAAIGLDQVARGDLARPEGDDGDLALVDDGQDALPGVSGPDAEAMEAAGPAQADPPPRSTRSERSRKWPGAPRPAGSTGAWLQRLESTLSVAAQETLEMLPTEPVLGGGRGDGRLIRDDLEDGHPVLRHALDCHVCLDSPVAYQVSPMS